MTRNKTVKFSFLLAFWLVFVFAGDTFAQRKSVSRAEVTGTFQSCFSGKFRGSCSVIRVQALGKGKLKVQFSPIYPFVDGNGDLSANTGEATGEISISGDKAVYETSEFGQCRIVLHFKRPGILVVTQTDETAGCGFGYNVTAEGTYKKASSKKPKFETY